MQLFQALATGRLCWLCGVWVGLTLIWVFACLGVERDARLIFGQSRRWKLLFVVMGVLMFLAACGGGPVATYLAGLPLFGAITCYTLARERRARSEQRLLQMGTVRSILTRLVPIPLVQDWLDRKLRSNRELESEKDFAVRLTKKDGSEYRPVHGGGSREIADALQTTHRIMSKAIRLRATDVHFEPKSGQEYQVRFRIDGILQTRQVIQDDAGKAVVSAIKVLADMDIAERRRPQDGTFAASMEGRKFDVRAASGPTNFGEKLSLRIMESDGGIVKSGLPGIGMRKSHATTLRDLIGRPHGMLVVSGPTGSGKTTSLYALLHEIDVLTRNVVTIEDPIEYRLEGISQTAVNNSADLTFAKILRSVLRQDPDVILVGEIRDCETAEIAMRAALTGHFVFTTVHANDSIATITRLIDIGVEATLIQSALSAVLAQRLIRLLCPLCKQPYEPPPQLVKQLGIPPERATTFFREKGCDRCHGTGYFGRTGVHELMVLDANIRSLLVGRPSAEDIHAATRASGMRTLWQSALYKVIDGQTSVAEAERVVR